MSLKLNDNIVDEGLWYSAILGDVNRRNKQSTCKKINETRIRKYLNKVKNQITWLSFTQRWIQVFPTKSFWKPFPSKEETGEYLPLSKSLRRTGGFLFLFPVARRWLGRWLPRCLRWWLRLWLRQTPTQQTNESVAGVRSRPEVLKEGEERPRLLERHEALLKTWGRRRELYILLRWAATGGVDGRHLGPPAVVLSPPGIMGLL